MIKAGLIGTGIIGKTHIESYKQIIKDKGDIELIAVCDTNGVQLELDNTIKVYTDTDEFLKNEKGNIDFIDLCVPTFLHKELSIRAMEEGYHVLCEKPMALTEEDTLSMIKVSEETGKLLMIAHCERFTDVYKKLKDFANSKKFGLPISAEFTRLDGNPGRNWLFNKSLSGGSIVDLHIHDADIMNMIFGMPKAVSAVSDPDFRSASINYIYDDFYVNSKCDWTIENNKFNSRTARINFENGYIYYNQQMEIFIITDKDGKSENIYSSLINRGYYDEIVYFGNCIKTGEKPDACPPKQSSEAIKLVLNAFESAKNKGKKININ